MEGINSLNSKPKKAFKIIYARVKDYVKYDGRNVEPVHIFLSGSKGTGKSHLLKYIMPCQKHCFTTIKTQKSRAFFYSELQEYYCKYPETTIHSDLPIKPGTKLLSLNYKSKTVSRNRLSEVKFLVIDELSMVSNGLWTDIGSELGGIFIMIPEKVFARPSIMTAADLLQLPPIRGKLIF